MAIATVFTNLFARNSVFVSTVFFGAFAFGISFDTAASTWWDKHNRGKQWADSNSTLIGSLPTYANLETPSRRHNKCNQPLPPKQMLPPLPLKEWDSHLLPLLALLRREPPPSSSRFPTTFHDEAGHSLDFSGLSPEILLKDVGGLLKGRKDHAVQVKKEDGAVCFLTLQRHNESGRWVLSRTEFREKDGVTTQSVVVDDWSEVEEFLMGLRQ